MAAAAAAAAALSFSSSRSSSSFFPLPSFLFSSSPLRTPIVFSSSSPSLRIHPHSSFSSSSSPRFNITFGDPPPKSQTLTLDTPNSSNPQPSNQNHAPVFIPWIVRDENGNFKIQSHPPDHILNAMADAKTTSSNSSSKKKKKEPVKEKKGGGLVASSSLTSEPRFSKAARRYYNENFREPPQRLSKVLAAAGVASRRACEELIFDKRVSVNGAVCNTPQTLVDPLKDAIYVNGNRLAKKLPPKLYFALNKPKGYICSSGKEESKSVLSLFDGYWKTWGKANPGVPKPRLFTVGRLDVATTGLIIVTNDGDFAQRLSHPSSNVTKEYVATIDGSISKRSLQAISEGVLVDGVHCKPDFVELLPSHENNDKPRVRVVVHEGRNHEVRHLVKNAGLKLYSLKRVRVGGFRLPSELGLGKHIELKEKDLKLLGGSQ